MSVAKVGCLSQQSFFTFLLDTTIRRLGERDGQRGTGGEPVQVQWPAVRPHQPAVLPESQVLQSGHRPIHPGGHLPGRRSEPVCLLRQQSSVLC